MNVHAAGESWSLYHVDCRVVLATLPDCSVDSVVTDPPYGLSNEPDAAEVLGHWLAGDDYEHKGGGFMGKSWDSFVPGPSVWREVYRVLKPGGYICVFGGTRTYDLMVMAIRLAGFEVRDQIMAWCFASGFPKSLDVSKAIDKQRDTDVAAAAIVAKWLCDKMEARNVTRRDITDHFGAANIAQQWTTHWTDGAVKPRVPRWEQWQELRTWLDLPDDMDAEVWRLNGRKGQPGENWWKREVVGQRDVPIGHSFAGPTYGGDSSNKEVAITAAATDAAKQWEGWGTALKPAHEPIVLARKSLIGTVAANVLQHGTGALNIDGTRVPASDTIALVTGKGTLGGTSDGYDRPWKNDPEAVARREERAAEAIVKANTMGRWPANVIFDTEAGALLDEQSGVIKGGTWNSTQGARPFNNKGEPTNYQTSRKDESSGGASRFFTAIDWESEIDVPFRYVAKPSKRERTCDGTVSGIHPTVKPLALMRWLVRLVTPPGGTVLEPFAGSGTTLMAAIMEGFNGIGIEMTDEYLPIIEGRVKWAENNRPEPEPPEQLGLLG